METAVIAYRVADFLKRHPPFHAIDDADLLGLAARGRVRFHEPNEYILWQGEPHRLQVFVIQQGTVSLWDETGERVELRDVRGVGDMLGIERYCDAPHCLYSGRSESDVVIYAFPALDFDEFVLKYPARRAVRRGRRPRHAGLPAGGRATGSAEHLSARGRGPETALDLPRPRQHRACRAALSRHAVRQAMAVVDADGPRTAVLTAETLLAWVAGGGGNAQQQAIETLLEDAPTVMSPDASVTDGVHRDGRAPMSGARDHGGRDAGRPSCRRSSRPPTLRCSSASSRPRCCVTSAWPAGCTSCVSSISARAP